MRICQRITPEELKFLKDYYPDKGAEFCSERLNRKYDAITKLAGYYKIKRNRKYPVDIHFFDFINTEFKAYFLGFLMADGNIFGNNISIKLGLKDENHLRLLSKLWLNGQDIVTFVKPGKSPPMIRGRIIKDLGAVSLSISCKEWVEPLHKLNMVPAKSLILRFPDINQGLLNHFVRGYFDGDGCLASRKNAGAIRYTMTIVSSESFCDTLQKISKDLINFKVSSYKNNKIYRVEAGGNNKVKAFCDWMYKDATIYLERKYLKYQELLQNQIRIASKIKSKYSIHKGITFDKSRGKWNATYRKPRNTIHIGSFNTEQEAYQARLNFIQNQSLTI